MNQVEYTIEIEYIDDYKIIHQTPILSDEERKEKEKEILYKIYQLFSSKI